MQNNESVMCKSPHQKFSIFEISNQRLYWSLLSDSNKCFTKNINFIELIMHVSDFMSLSLLSDGWLCSIHSNSLYWEHQMH